MGIPGLHPKLEKAKHTGKLKDFTGKTALVDTFIWVCQILYGKKLQYAGTAVFGYCIQQILTKINLLLEHNITPIMIFDGRRLPGKAKAHAERELMRGKRRKILKEAFNKEKISVDNSNESQDELDEMSSQEKETQQYYNKIWEKMEQDEKIDRARDCAQYGTDIVHELILEFQKHGIQYLVAPYEADPQIAYLAREGYGDIVITEDGDLTIHGCQQICFKLQGDGNVNEVYERRLLHQCVGFAEGYNRKRMIWRAILGGCDYLKNLHGIGIGKAIQIVEATPEPFNTEEMLRSIPEIVNKPDLKITDKYIKDFKIAEFIFTHAIVFDPKSKKLVPINPYPIDYMDSTLISEQMNAAGPMFDDQEAYDLSRGIISSKVPHIRYNTIFFSSTNIDCNSVDKHYLPVPLSRPTSSGLKTIEIKPRKVFKCFICKRIFKCLRDLEYHNYQHTGVKKFKCPDPNCSSRFRSKVQLVSHYRIHTGDKPYVCGICYRRFSTNNSLWQHKSFHTGVKKYSCDHCSMRFRFKSAQITHHAYVHSGERPFKCQQCPKTFKHKIGIREHINCHREGRYKCEVCGKRFKFRSGIKVHLTHLHAIERETFSCNICGRVMYATSRAGHMREIHYKPKKFPCDQCNFETTTRSRLSEHQRIHNSERLKFTCDLCGKVLFETSRRPHMSHVHPKTKKFGCDECSYKTTTRRDLTIHFAVHNNEREFECDMCGYQTWILPSLKLHQKLHRPRSDQPVYYCEICSVPWTNKNSLAKHAKKCVDIAQKPNQLRTVYKGRMVKNRVREKTPKARLAHKEWIQGSPTTHLNEFQIDETARRAVPREATGVTHDHPIENDKQRTSEKSIMDSELDRKAGCGHKQRSKKRKLELRATENDDNSRTDTMYSNITTISQSSLSISSLVTNGKEIPQDREKQCGHKKRRKIRRKELKENESTALTNIIYSKSDNFATCSVSNDPSTKSYIKILQDRKRECGHKKRQKLRKAELKTQGLKSITMTNMVSSNTDNLQCSPSNYPSLKNDNKNQKVKRRSEQRNKTKKGDRQEHKPSPDNMFQRSLPKTSFLISSSLKMNPLTEDDTLESRIVPTHEVININGRKFYCNQCKFTTKRKKTLADHVRVHNNERNYKCDFCGHKMLTISNKKEHEKQHHIPEGTTGFPCPKCNVKWRSQFSLSLHITKEHRPAPEMKDGRFVCSLCKSTFTYQSGWYLHMKHFHPV